MFNLPPKKSLSVDVTAVATVVNKARPPLLLPALVCHDTHQHWHKDFFYNDVEWFLRRYVFSFWLKYTQLGFIFSVESLQSQCIHTQFYWSSGPPVCFLSWGTWVKSPGGYLCETSILLLASSRYIGDPDMIDHCGLVWGGLRSEPY